MPDNTTGLHVKSLATETVRARLVDTGGTNEAAISAAGRLSVDGSGVTQPVSGTVAISTLGTITPGTAATNLGKAEDAGHTTGDVGVMALAVRNDAGTALAGTDLDYIPLSTDSSGALRVTGGSGGTQYTEDVASAGAEALTLAGAIRQDTPASSTTTDGDYTNLKTDSLGRLWVNSSNVTQPVSIAATVTVDTELPTAAALADATATPTVPAVGAFLMGWNGTNWDRVDTANTGRLQVDVVTGGGSNASVLVDNAAFTDGTSSVTGVGFIFDEVAGTALTENDIAAARIDSKRAIINVLEDATTRGQRAAISAAGALANNLTQIGGNAVVTAGLNGTLGVGGTTAHDGAAAAILPVLQGGYASAAAPTDVSADNDAVRQWHLRNGSQVVNLASGGTLLTIGQKTMANSFPVVISSDQSNLPANITQIGGATPSATAFLPARLTDGTAYYTNTGQTAATAPFTRITDATNTAAVIATINALKTDMSSIVGAVPSATNPLPVRLTDGAAFYAASSGAPIDPQVSTASTASLGAGASADIDHTAITTAETGYLMGVDVSSAVPLKIEIKTVNAGTPTTRVVAFTQNGDHFVWRPPFKTFITQAGGATSRFRVSVTNRDNSQASDVYSTAFWDSF